MSVRMWRSEGGGKLRVARVLVRNPDPELLLIIQSVRSGAAFLFVSIRFSVSFVEMFHHGSLRYSTIHVHFHKYKSIHTDDSNSQNISRDLLTVVVMMTM